MRVSRFHEEQSLLRDRAGAPVFSSLCSSRGRGALGDCVKRVRLLGIILSVVIGAAIACEPYYRVVVTAPLARPLSSDCIRSALDTIARSPRTVAEVDKPPPKVVRATRFLLGGGTPYATVWHYEYRDSTAALETLVGRPPPGPRFSRAEAENLGQEMGTTLLRVRDACGGSGVSGSPPYRIKRKPR
jgi:hypothetical protein